MCISAGTITNSTHSSTNVAPVSSKSPHIPGHSLLHSSDALKEMSISGILSRDKSNDPPERANISLYDTPRGKDRKDPLLTFKAVTQASAIYPDRPNLIGNSTLIKLEGTYGDERTCADMKCCEGWILLELDLEGAGSGEMLRWLIGERVPFSELL
jgi:CCR4-NOT transcriptional complex subunit CAF120